MATYSHLLHRLLFALMFIYLRCAIFENRSEEVQFIINVQSAVCRQYNFEERIDHVPDVLLLPATEVRTALSIRLPIVIQHFCCAADRSCTEKPGECYAEYQCCLETRYELMLNEMINIDMKYTCDFPQVKRFKLRTVNAVEAVRMIRSCPFRYVSAVNDTHGRIVVEKCENKQLFDDIESYTPVSDSFAMTTYQNVFCAMCNGASESDLIYWNINIKCLSYYMFSPTSMHTLVKEIIDATHCNVIFTVPSQIPPAAVEYCLSYLQECNVTGKWHNHNDVVEAACLSYTMVYNYQYKNVFCYLCNIDSTTIPTDGCIVSPDPSGIGGVVFSALLSFKPFSSTPSSETVVSMDTLTSICTDTQIYDPYQEQCLDVSCVSPKILSGDHSCGHVIDTLSGITISVFMRMEPIVPIRDTDIKATANNLQRHFIYYFQKIDIYKHVYKFRLYIRKKEHANDTHTYFITHFQLHPVAKYPMKMIDYDKLLNLEGTTYVDNSEQVHTIDFKTQLTVCHETDVIQQAKKVEDIEDKGEDIEMEDIEKQVEEGQEQEQEGEEQEHEEEVESSVGEAQSTVLVDIKTNLTLDLIKSFDFLKPKTVNVSSTSVLTRVHKCPVVLLDLSKFNATFVDNGVILFKDIDLKIQVDEYVMPSIDKGGVEPVLNTFYICVDQYTAIAKKLFEQTHTSITNKHIPSWTPKNYVSLICTCLSLLFSLLTLATYAAFESLRTQPGINNIGLTCSLFCAQMLFQFGINQSQTGRLICTIVGILIHYSWMNVLLWMNVCTLHMLKVFHSIAIVGRRENALKTTARYTLYCLAIAAVPVIVNIGVVATETNGLDIGYGGEICYISRKIMVAYVFLFPVALVVLVNLGMFVEVMVHIGRTSSIRESSNITKNRNFLKIYTKLSSLTGITWTFGFIYALTEIEAFDYLFITFNASQGLFMFAAFVCNKRVMSKYSKMFCPTKVPDVPSSSHKVENHI